MKNNTKAIDFRVVIHIQIKLSRITIARKEPYWQFMLFFIFQIFPILGKPKNRFWSKKPIFIDLPINHRPSLFFCIILTLLVLASAALCFEGSWYYFSLGQLMIAGWSHSVLSSCFFMSCGLYSAYDITCIVGINGEKRIRLLKSLFLTRNLSLKENINSNKNNKRLSCELETYKVNWFTL